LGRPEPSGVRLVLAGCTEPGRDDELNSWYDDYAADCTRPGRLVNAIRYRNLGDEGPLYAAIYDMAGDPETAWPETQDHPARLVHTRSPLLDVALKASYRRIEPLDPVGDAPVPRTVTIVLSDDAAARSSSATRVTRYELVEGEPDPPRFLEIHESESAEPPVVTGGPNRLAASYVRTFATAYRAAQ
jgi:hypothetical protein